MSAILVIDLRHVTIDGATAGCVADAFANFAESRADLQAALEAWSTAALADAAAVATKELTATLTERTAERDKLFETAKALQAQLDGLSQKLCDEYQAKLDQQLDAMGEQVRLLKVDRDGRLDQATKTIQDHEKTIAELQGQTAAMAKDVAFQKELTNRHWETTKRVLDAGKPEAVAAAQELRRLEIIGLRASLDAEEAAIVAAQSAKA